MSITKSPFWLEMLWLRTSRGSAWLVFHAIAHTVGERQRAPCAHHGVCCRCERCSDERGNRPWRYGRQAHGRDASAIYVPPTPIAVLLRTLQRFALEYCRSSVRRVPREVSGGDRGTCRPGCYRQNEPRHGPAGLAGVEDHTNRVERSLRDVVESLKDLVEEFNQLRLAGAGALEPL